MSNSSLVSYTKISPFRSEGRTINVNGKPTTYTIDRITPHCVQGQCSIEALGAEFAKAEKKASSNYGIGKDGRVGMFVEEKDRSWCSSSSANDVRAVTIECASDAFSPYAFNDTVYEKLIQLCADICHRDGKTKLIWFGYKDKAINYTPAKNEMILTVHRWFATDGRSCPGDWLFNRLYEFTDRVNAILNPPAPVIPVPDPTEEDDTVTYEQFKEYWYRLRRELQDNDSSEYSKEARDWGIQTGLVKGGSTPLPNNQVNYMWEDFVTREQMVTLLFRFLDIVKKLFGK